MIALLVLCINAKGDRRIILKVYMGTGVYF
jgi:hypothetical protein